MASELASNAAGSMKDELCSLDVIKWRVGGGGRGDNERAIVGIETLADEIRWKFNDPHYGSK